MSMGNRPTAHPRRVERARRRLTPSSAQETIARIQTALCEPARLRIVQALTAGPLTVDDLAAVIERPPTATSQHLRVLRDAGVVERTRRGIYASYRVAQGPTGAHVRAVLRSVERGAKDR